jgi:hypothetical protein
MPTPAQLAANRANAQKSTGPRTPGGKAAAAGNALRHGMATERLLVGDERWQDFVAFHDELRSALAPADAVEEQLVERIVLCAWRLRRIAPAEAGATNVEARHVDSSDQAARDAIGFTRAAWKFEIIARYEASLERAYRRASLMLERRQARRAGERVLPPIAVDVEIEAVGDASA